MYPDLQDQRSLSFPEDVNDVRAKYTQTFLKLFYPNDGSMNLNPLTTKYMTDTILNSNSNMNDDRYFHRNLRGVVDECCKQPCHPSTLSLYCSVPRENMVSEK